MNLKRWGIVGYDYQNQPTDYEYFYLLNAGVLDLTNGYIVSSTVRVTQVVAVIFGIVSCRNSYD